MKKPKALVLRFDNRSGTTEIRIRRFMETWLDYNSPHQLQTIVAISKRWKWETGTVLDVPVTLYPSQIEAKSLLNLIVTFFCNCKKFTLLKHYFNETIQEII